MLDSTWLQAEVQLEFFRYSDMYLHSELVSCKNSYWISLVFRYDYEKVDKEAAEKVIGGLRSLIDKGSLTGQKYSDYVIKVADDYRYEDTIDKSVSEKQVGSVVYCRPASPLQFIFGFIDILNNFHCL